MSRLSIKAGASKPGTGGHGVSLRRPIVPTDRKASAKACPASLRLPAFALSSAVLVASQRRTGSPPSDWVIATWMLATPVRTRAALWPRPAKTDGQWGRAMVKVG